VIGIVQLAAGSTVDADPEVRVTRRLGMRMLK